MAILQHNPVTLHGTVFDVRFGLLTHSLTQSTELEFVHAQSDSFHELLDITERISSGTQDEHDWSQGSGAVVDLHEVQWWGFHVVVVVHLSDQEVLDGIHASVWSDDSHQHKLLELAQGL